MKAKRYTQKQIISFFQAQEARAQVSDLVREHGFSEKSFYHWKAKCGEIEPAPANGLEIAEVGLPQLVRSGSLVLEPIDRRHHPEGRIPIRSCAFSRGCAGIMVH